MTPMTPEQNKILLAESWTLCRAMCGDVKVPEDKSIRGDDGYTVIDFEAYITDMKDRLYKVFPAHPEPLEDLKDELIRIRGYTAPESFGMKVGEAFGNFHLEVEK